ncbi:MAG: nitrogen regulation protein NR(I) [Gammaproteobacteria bacterium]|nr:nitrogen regulation protein NR(I) [Gammaproteobacteria bacterium]
MTQTIWIIDDDESIRWVLDRALTKAGYTTRTFESGDSVMTLLRQEPPDAVITDIRMPGVHGLDLLGQIHREFADLPVIVMTAHTDLESAVDSYRGGAFEYLPKPFDLPEAVRLVERAVTERAAHEPASGEADAPSALIGEAPAMQEVYRAIGRLANSRVNVLICGESGTGKELVARALHTHSARADQPLVTINTAAVPAELLESELFGHEKGAFTGAHERRIGRFEQAHQGTLFLDEIGDMPPHLQTRLLRVLSDHRFYRVGGHREIEVDVRIIAATHQDLERSVAEGRFREDLFHRLNVIRLDLPPLRDRREDIPLLAGHFLAASARELQVETRQLTPEAAAVVAAHDWPGNVRQLENMCRWITVMAPSQQVTREDLPAELRREEQGDAGRADWTRHLKRTVERHLNLGDCDILRKLGDEFERTLLTTALHHTHGHKQEAARRLGWGRNTLTRKLKELDIEQR